jgi:type IV secretory pathway TraG/TraD family ATPase VirD4
MRSDSRKPQKKATEPRSPGIHIGKGFDIQDPNPKTIDIEIADSERKGHFFCFGTGGAGKTKLMENMIVQDIKKGNSVVCVDPKGDTNLASKIVQTAHECGREQELSIVSPIYPHLSAKTNDFMERLEKGEGVILIAQISSLLAGKTAHVVYRDIISMIQAFAGCKLPPGGSTNQHLALYIDEFQYVAYPNIEALFSKGRSSNVMCHAFTQSIADIDDAIGHDKSRKILDDTNVKLFMRVNDPGTAKYIVNYSGTTITVEDVMSIRMQDFYLFTTQSGYRGRSNNTEEAKLLLTGNI